MSKLVNRAEIIAYMFNAFLSGYKYDSLKYEFDKVSVRDHGSQKYFIFYHRIIGILRKENIYNSNNINLRRTNFIIDQNSIVMINKYSTSVHKIQRNSISTSELLFELQLLNLTDTQIIVFLALNLVSEEIPDEWYLLIPDILGLFGASSDLDLIRNGLVL